MRAIHNPKSSKDRRYRRHLRVRQRVIGTPERPRLVVFRSLKHIYAQLVDDTKGTALFGVSDTSEGIATAGAGKVGKATAVGQLIAARAKAAGITKVMFDRAGYQYHGRVAAVAEGARKGGLEF